MGNTDYRYPPPANASSASSAEEYNSHKVAIPPPQPFFKSLKYNLKETFFPDDPLRQFKNQRPTRKFVLGLQYFFPIFEWGSRYTLEFLKSDVISGVTIASLAIPQGISYAKLANLPPILGLYSSFIPPLVYAMMGSSRDLAVGTVAVASLLTASMLGSEVSAVDNPKLYLHLAFTATFFAGVFQAALGLLRLGFIVDFLSHATIVGFMAGAATVVILQQLKGILGLEHFTRSTDLVSVLRSVFSQTHQWRWESAVLGFCFLFFLLVTKQFSKKRPKFFWISALAPLTSVILGSVLVYFTHAEKHGVQVIGELKKGLNPLSFGDLVFVSPYLSIAIKTGIITGIIALAEGIAVGRSFAMYKHYHIDGNKEMIAIGTMNIVGSCASCYLTTGPFSRSAVNFNAGCKTAVSNIVMALAVMLTLLVEIGLVVAVGISVLRVLLFVARPKTFILGNIPNSGIYRNVEQYPNAATVPGVLVLEIDAPIYFANSSYLRERIARWIDDEEDRLKASGEASLQYVILNMGAVGNIDTSGISMLEEVKKVTDRRGLKLVLANPGAEVTKKLNKAKFMDKIGSEWFFLTVGEAVGACNYMLHTYKPTSHDLSKDESAV
ncbi:Sulfate transporter 3.1 [Linum perenne]